MPPRVEIPEIHCAKETLRYVRGLVRQAKKEAECPPPAVWSAAWSPREGSELLLPDRTALFVSGPVSQPPLRRFGVAEPTNSGEFATAVAFRFHDPDDGADGIWQIARLPEAAREVAVQLGRPMVEVCLGEFAGDTFRGLDTRNYATLQLAHMTGVFARALVVVSDLGSI